PASKAPTLELQPLGSGSAGARPAANPVAEAANAASHARAAALAPSPVKRGNAMWAIAGIVLVFLAIGAAGFVWYQIESLKPPPPVARVRSNAALLPPAAPTPAPASGIPSSGPPPLLEPPPRASSVAPPAAATSPVPAGMA